MTQETDFQRLLRTKREEINARKGVTPTPEPVIQQPNMPGWEGDEPGGRERTPEDLEMDRIIDSVDIRLAYIKWCGKMTPVVNGNQRESIMISCPKPEHGDSNPSAWINLDKQTWYCGGCQEGGDKFDIAAYNLGEPVPGYKEGANFHRLREKMAEGMGWTKVRVAGGSYQMVAPEPEPTAPVASELIADTTPSAPVPIPVPLPVPQREAEDAEPYPEPMYPSPDKVRGPGGDAEDDGPTASVTPLYVVPPNEYRGLGDIQFPAIHWRDFVPENTFLRSYMDQTTIDDVPEEYHFWNGLIALGFALGKDVKLSDSPPVYGNLFVCTLGKTGAGKSKAAYHMNTLLKKAFPVDAGDPLTKGVEKINSPASAEVLVYNFQRPIMDPTDPTGKKILTYAPVRGLIDFNELAALVGRTQRQGNTLDTTLMEFYDMAPTVSTSSMTTGKKVAEHPFASALTTTQPKALGELLSKGSNEGGFLNRWVFAGGVYKTRVAIGGAIVDTDPCVPYLKNVQGWCGFSKTIEWDEKAHHLFTQYFHEVLEPVKEQNDLYARVDLLAKKLCLLLTANMRNEKVTGQVVEQVKVLMTYVIACYGHTADEIGNTDEQKLAEDVLRMLTEEAVKQGGTATINHIVGRLKRRYSRTQIKYTLDNMAALQEIEAFKTTGVGRPTTRYRLVQ